MAEFAEIPSGLELTVAEPVPGDTYHFWVGNINVTEDELSAIDDEDDFMSKLSYVDFAVAKNTEPLTFTFVVLDSSNFGSYTARLIHVGEDGTEDAYYTYRAADPTLSLRALEAFMNVNTNEEFFDKLTEFSVAPNDFFDYDDLGLLQDEAVAEMVGENFALIRDYKFADGGAFELASEIIKCAEAAYALSGLLGEDSEEASDRIANYTSFVPELFPAKDDTEVAMRLLTASKEYIVDAESLGQILATVKKYSETIDDDDLRVFDNLKTEVTSGDELESVIKWSVALSKLKDATRADIEKIITDNSTLLGVDISADAHYGISLANVAHRFDTTKAESLYGATAFGEYYDSIAKAIYEENQKQSQQQAGRPSSSGGGGGSFSGKTAYVKPQEATVPEKTEELQKDAVLPFGDISDCVWAHEDIINLYDKGIISGVDDDSFEPSRPVTRAEFVKMMVVAFNISGDNQVIFAFDDVSRDMWSYPYIEAAYRAGIVSGKAKTFFGASETITRQDAAVMIARALGMTGTFEQSIFSDAADISDYARDAVAAVAESGIMNGIANGSFDPMGTTTRAQAAVIISRALQGGASK